MCLMIRISMVLHPPPSSPPPPLTLFHKMSRIADCQCDISCFPLSLFFSPCFCCCFFFLCVSRLCSKYGLCLCVSICVCVCVCESVCSRNCVAHFLRMPTMATATATALVSAAWNTFFVSMETGMICPQPETCSMLWPPSPSPFSLHYTLVSFRPDRSVTGKTTRDFPSTIFQSLPRLLVSRSHLFLKVVSDSLTRKTIWTHKGFWE